MFFAWPRRPLSRKAVRTITRSTRVVIEHMEDRTLFAMPTMWTVQGPGGGGALFSAAVNGNELWVASDMSGIYHSGNFGQSWNTLNFHNSATGGIAGGANSQVQFTSDPNILYVATSNVGPAKSTDKGATWSKMTGWANGTAYWAETDETSTTKLLVANANNLYVSTNGGTSFTTAYASSGLFVAGAFFDGSTVYVGTNKGLLVSTNGGTSFSLHSQQIPAGSYMISFTGAKVGGVTRLIATTSNVNPTGANSQSARSYNYNGLWRLDVGGVWTNKSGNVTPGGQPKFVQMARNNINVVYLGGRDASSNPQVLKSTTGGDSWSDVFFTTTTDGGGVNNKNVYSGYNGQGGDFNWGWSGTPWSFVIDSDDANRAMLSNSGYIYVTSDGATTWHQAYVKPAYENTAGQLIPQHKFYQTAGIDPTSVHYLTWTSPNNIMASYTDITGWRSTDGGQTWAYPTWNGNADNTVYKTELYPDGKLYGAASNVHDMYQSNYLLDTRTNPTWQNGRVIVSSDQGATWSLIHEFNHPVVWIERDPNNPNRMYASVVDGIASPDSGAFGGIWVTNNLNLGASSTWTKLANPPRTEGHPYYVEVLNDGTLVATYSGRRFDNGTGEKFTPSSGVFYSTNGGASWDDRSDTNMLYYTKGITIDPTDPSQNTWWATVANGWSGLGNDLGDVYRSTNRGATWTKLNIQNVLGVTSIGVNSVTINPSTKELYIATEVRGVLYAPDVTVPGFSSANISDVTSFPHQWVERVFVNPYNNQDIWVASFGGGIWRGSPGPSALSATPASSTQINLAWTQQTTNEGGFEIQRATNATFTTGLVTTNVAANATNAAIGGLTAGITYYFRLRATGANYPSAFSNTVNATTTTGVTLNQPTGLSATPVSTSQINLAWTDNSSGETGYKIERATNAAGPWTQIHAGTTANLTTYNVSSGLSPDTTYYFRVRSYQGVNNGPFSATVNAKTHSTAISEVIVDNAAAVLTGTWTPSTSSAGYYGSNYLTDGNTGKGTKSARFSPTLAAGTYNVYARWTAYSNRATNTPFDINHAGGTTTVLKNQQTNNNTWVLLGTFTFNAGSAGNVTIRTTGTNGHVIADAVRFTPAPAVVEQIVDNTSATLTGAWNTSSNLAGYYGPNYLHDGNTGKGTKTARFTPNLSVAGTYQVYARWGAWSDRSSNTPFDITHAGGTSTVIKDQRTNNNVWVLLGTYTFNAGTGGYVTIRTTGTTGYVIADAVRFLKV